MSKLFDNRQVEHCYLSLIKFATPKLYKNSQNEDKYSFDATLIFELKDANKELVSLYNVTFVIADEITTRPTAAQCVALLVAAQENLNTFIAQVKTNKSGYTA